MIGLAIDRFPADSLRRVLDAPIEQWHSGFFWRNCDRLCLYGHAFNSSTSALAMHDNHYLPKLHRFDKLVVRFGTPRTVRACKIRALKALERLALDCAVPQLQETA